MSSYKAMLKEVRANSPVFQAALPELVKTHYEKFALMRHRAIVGIFDSCNKALKWGVQQFPDGIFSIGEIIVGPFDARWEWDEDQGTYVISKGWMWDEDKGIQVPPKRRANHRGGGELSGQLSTAPKREKEVSGRKSEAHG